MLLITCWQQTIQLSTSVNDHRDNTVDFSLEYSIQVICVKKFSSFPSISMCGSPIQEKNIPKLSLLEPPLLFLAIFITNSPQIPWCVNITLISRLSKTMSLA